MASPKAFGARGLIARMKRAVLAVIVLLAVGTAASGGLFTAANDWLRVQAARVTPAADGTDAVIVAIDTASLQRDRAWPWPRDRYADLLDVLSEGGARQVAFDIDFSSEGPGDADFANSLEAATMPVYGAVFRREYDAMPGVFAEMLPTQALRGRIAPVTTTYRAGEDGLVRGYEDRAEFSFGAVPSMAFALADRRPTGADIVLSLARRPGGVPVYSFGDVVSGRIDPSAFEGRTVFVGATAIELGDEFALPGYGLQTGVMVNALAYEAAVAGDFPTLLGWPFGLALGLIGVVAATMRWPGDRRGMQRFVAVNAAAAAAVLAIAVGMQAAFAWVAPVAEAFCVHALCLVGAALLALDGYAARDFRARMALRANAALMESIIARNHEGVVIVDADGLIERANDKAATLAGWPGDTLEGARLSDAFPALVRCLDEDGETGGVRTEAADESVVDVHWSRIATGAQASPYERRRKARISTVVMLHDVTPLVAAERAEREAREEHERASAAKSALMMTMSHELRTPLNAVIGFSDLIRDEACGPHAAPEYKEYAGLAADGGRQLLRVVDDLLRAARFQAGKVACDLREVRLSDLVASAAEKAAALPGAACPALDDRCGGATARLDSDLVQLALVHLFENAAKYAGADAAVSVCASVGEDAFRLTVCDDGPGLSADADPDRLTELFVQQDASLSRKDEGCGLGLFLVRSVAEAHGGRLEIDGQGGFSATLVLPPDGAKAGVEAFGEEGRPLRLCA